MRYRDILREGRIINIDGSSDGLPNLGVIRFIENPSVSQLISFAGQHDLRGTSDGKNIYIWDAGIIIHHNAKWALRNEADFYNVATRPDGSKYEVTNDSVKYFFNFYVVNNKNVRADKEIREEWLNAKRCDFYMLDKWTYICVLKGVGDSLRAVNANYARIFAPATMVPGIPRRGVPGSVQNVDKTSGDPISPSGP